MSLRVLITNITLAERTGTEINVRDIALGLLRRGHRPVVYTRDPGTVADEIRRATVPVVDDLTRIGAPPDVIHGHHHPELMQALLHFPGIPAVFFSHDYLAWHDAPPVFPRILRYVAVDETNRDRLVLTGGISPDRVRVVLNAVDLDRFLPRGPLPAHPGRALVFSNYARADTHLPAVREACARAEIPLDVVGVGAGTRSEAPETLLGRYDLVFAKGRCALEALAVGAAVVLCDYSGLGPMVTSGELDRLRSLNFGRRLLQAPLDAARIAREVARYDPADVAEVSRRLRAIAGLEAQLDVLEALYREVIAEHVHLPSDLVAEERALAAYLDAWGPRFKDGPLRSLAEEYRERLEHMEVETRRAHEASAQLEQRVSEIETRRGQLEALCAELETRCTRLQNGVDAHRRLLAEHATLRAERNALDAELARVRNEMARVRADLHYVTGTATWRLRDVLVRSRWLTAAYRGLRRLAPSRRRIERTAPSS